MSAKDFFDLVCKMRYCQKEYFRTRDKNMLNSSKDLEKQVDNEIARVINILKSKNEDVDK